VPRLPEINQRIEDLTFVKLPETAARSILAIQDEEIREKVVSSISNAIESGKDPITGEFTKSIPASTVEAVIQRESITDRAPVLFSSDSPEWYTPEIIITSVIQVFGNIDLDPCSNNGGKPNVPAKVHYTKEMDGLTRSWSGKVYMNPPYGREIEQWVRKLLDEYQKGETTEAIALVPARTDTKWFNLLSDYPWCAIEGRLTFSNSEMNAPFPSAVFYLGENVRGFWVAFAPHGTIYHQVAWEDADVS